MTLDLHLTETVSVKYQTKLHLVCREETEDLFGDLLRCEEADWAPGDQVTTQPFFCFCFCFSEDD